MRDVVPEEQRLAFVLQQRHQLALHRQQVIKAHEDIGPILYLVLDTLFLPSLDDRPLSQSRVAFLLL